MLNGTPKPRNAEARKCGSEKWKARKARKVRNKNRCAQRHSKASEWVAGMEYPQPPSPPSPPSSPSPPSLKGSGSIRVK
ncbi:MAG: hypothetical protein WC721_03655 [Victivallaceae bacterium]